MSSAAAARNINPDAPVSDFDPYAEDVLRDPWPYYQQLREVGPAIWLERYGALAFFRHEQVHAILSDPYTYCSSAGVGLTNFRTETPWRKPSIILEADPPEHGRARKVVARILSPAWINKLRPTFEREAEKLVDKVLAKETFDAAKDFSEAYPLKVFADAVGLPAEGRENLLPYGDMVFNGFGPINERFKKRMETSGQAVQGIAEVCRRESLTKDGLGADLYAAADAGELTHEEAGMLVRTLLSAGLDTTVFTLCNAMLCFAKYPDQWEILRENPSMARQAIEEVLRYEPTFHSFYRTTTKPVEIAGVQIPENQKVVVFISSANRDPRRWENPDQFDIRRRASGNLAFGTGIHGCAGQMMARLEGDILLSSLARKMHSIELEGTPIPHFNNTVRGYASIPVKATPIK
ncbi:cytochrome P450 [Noviherbaspirillum pedocola]|uniref:Cytochrome P450 n=1 Tax=Noviherbaspirillum pedocola TaxID=2801341 RepID=A0A934T0W0_9BURK|nr:cytochrome P450 [Noviherbaspirillum pedocola]MBK4739354.1 cytochrome P450 [Noviherbaspirillum pedocola]